MARISELDRQAAVLAACRTPLPADQPLDASQTCWPAVCTAGLRTDAAGLRAYQVNAQATAKRVLASTYPTIAAMLGAHTLDALALLLWQQQPPDGGDLGDWDSGLPELLATHPDLQTWPWLADSARLDWAQHASERATDASLEAESLHLLGETAPEHIHMRLKPCVQVLTSNWPIADLWHAHQLPVDEQAQAATQALSQAQRTGTTVIWRNPWHIQIRCLTGAQADWMVSLASSQPSTSSQSCASLAQLLDQAPADFDFAEWLQLALHEGWLWRVTTDHSPSP